MNRKRRTQSSSHVQPCDSFGAARASGRLPVRSGLCGDRDELIHFGPDVSQIVFDIYSRMLASICWPARGVRTHVAGDGHLSRNRTASARSGANPSVRSSVPKRRSMLQWGPCDARFSWYFSRCYYRSGHSSHMLSSSDSESPLIVKFEAPLWKTLSTQWIGQANI